MPTGNVEAGESGSTLGRGLVFWGIGAQKGGDSKESIPVSSSLLPVSSYPSSPVKEHRAEMELGQVWEERQVVGRSQHLSDWGAAQARRASLGQTCILLG